MADMFKMLQQAQQMQGQLQEIQTRLEQATVVGTAGGGLVKVEASGKGAVRRVQIDPSVVNANDVGALEDLITVAVGDAQRRATELAEQEAKSLMGGMGLPFKLPF